MKYLLFLVLVFGQNSTGENTDLSDRAKLIIDVIEIKGLKNIIFVTGGDDVEEIFKIGSTLQANNATIAIVIIDYDDMGKEYDPMGLSKNIEEIIIKEKKEFHIFILPYNDQETDTVYSTEMIVANIRLVLDEHQKVRSSKTPHTKLIIVYQKFESLEFLQGENLLEFRDVYFFVPLQVHEQAYSLYQMYGICQFCERRFNHWWKRWYNWPKIIELNIWIETIGFQDVFDLPGSYMINFHMKSMKINIQLHPTTVWYDDKQDSYEGPLYEDLKLLSEMMNFTFCINCEPILCGQSDILQSYRRVRDPGVFNDEFLLLKKGEIDIVGGDYIASQEVHKSADISIPTFYQAGANIVSIEPSKSFRWYAIFQPFKMYVWLLVLGIVPFSGTILYLLRKFCQDPDKSASWKDSFWDVTVIICWHGVKSPDPPTAIIIFLSTYMLATYFIINEYTSSFTSFMVAPSYVRPPVESLDHLWNTDMMWLGGRMANYYAKLFENASDSESRIELMLLGGNESEAAKAIQKLLGNPDKYVYFERAGLMEWSVCHYDIDLNGQKLYYSKETVGNSYAFLYFQKGSIITEAFNRKISLLQDMGIIKHHQEIFHNANMKNKCLKKDIIKAEMITLVQLYIGFYFLAFGYALGIISLIAGIATEFGKEVVKMKRHCEKTKYVK